MLSYWPCQRLTTWQQQPAPPPRLARGAHPGPQIGFHCFLFLLVGVVLNRSLQIAGIVRCVGGSHRCTVAACSPRRCVCRLGLLVCSSAGGPSCHLPSASVDLSWYRRGWVRSFQRGHGEGTTVTVSLEVCRGRSEMAANCALLSVPAQLGGLGRF